MLNSRLVLGVVLAKPAQLSCQGSSYTLESADPTAREAREVVGSTESLRWRWSTGPLDLFEALLVDVHDDSDED